MNEISSSGRGLAACNCTNLRRAARQISHFYDVRLAPSGLRTSQYVILAHLRERGEQSINGIAAHLDMDRTTAGQNLRPLERDGLVVIARSPTDGRGRNVSLTDAGKAALETARPLWREAQADFENQNGSGEAAELRERLAGLRFE